MAERAVAQIAGSNRTADIVFIDMMMPEMDGVDTWPRGCANGRRIGPAGRLRAGSHVGLGFRPRAEAVPRCRVRRLSRQAACRPNGYTTACRACWAYESTMMNRPAECPARSKRDADSS